MIDYPNTFLLFRSGFLPLQKTFICIWKKRESQKNDGLSTEKADIKLLGYRPARIKPKSLNCEKNRNEKY